MSPLWSDHERVKQCEQGYRRHVYRRKPGCTTTQRKQRTCACDPVVTVALVVEATGVAAVVVCEAAVAWNREDPVVGYSVMTEVTRRLD